MDITHLLFIISYSPSKKCEFSYAVQKILYNNLPKPRRNNIFSIKKSSSHMRLAFASSSHNREFNINYLKN